MKRSALLILLGLGLGAACEGGGSLTAGDTFDPRYVGAWRVTAADDATTFSDYDFSDAGKLTLLRSVVHDQNVDPMQSVSTVSGVTGGVCVFDQTWFSDGGIAVTVGSSCTDGVVRQVALDFAADLAGISKVTVQSVDGQAGWMRPASWQFQHCNEHACD
jgi:hypothetical protein